MFFVQLIQDEIKALVQLQNRQIGSQMHSPDPQSGKTPKLPEDPATETSFPPSTPAPQLTVHPHDISEEGMATVLSSGYGTLSTWEHGLDPGRAGSADGRDEMLWSPNQQDGSFTLSPIPDTSPLGPNPLIRTITANDKLQTTAANASNPMNDKQTVKR